MERDEWPNFTKLILVKWTYKSNVIRAKISIAFCLCVYEIWLVDFEMLMGV